MVEILIAISIVGELGVNSVSNSNAEFVSELVNGGNSVSDDDAGIVCKLVKIMLATAIICNLANCRNSFSDAGSVGD